MDKSINFQPEAAVRVESTLCARFRCTKSHCDACTIVCPVPGAVLLSDEGAAITAACVGCGACVSACPNGALRPQENDARLVERIRERIQPGRCSALPAIGHRARPSWCCPVSRG
ncbi:4Fe-4S dicluster domain-containing protein [Dechloromonas sp. A34]|uniref:4Fe-4S dicluster domain-containing protein n=1 Tax=Dechloromonas sp. A34 TaxID=447588 RepID=UPI003A521490